MIRPTRIAVASLLLLTLTRPTSGQHVELSPRPQKEVRGQMAFARKGLTVQLHSADYRHIHAIAELLEGLSQGDKGIPLYIGKRGDRTLQAVQIESQIPNHTEGYYIRVTPRQILLAAHDERGLYYGAKTLKKILAAPKVMSVEVTDYPSMPMRGIIEGFYGNPYSHTDRLSLFGFMGDNKMNTYVYGPKDDPYHGFGSKWRDPYPEADARRIEELVRVAHQNQVHFVWAVHPGNHIRWTDDDGDGVIDDFVAAKTKFEHMYDLGVRAFAVFFDDIQGVGKDPHKQAQLMNYLTKDFVKAKGDVAPLILCPTQYNQAWAHDDYLDILGQELEESVRVMWTGSLIVDMINRKDMEWINRRLGRNAFIWLNYPVSDYCEDHLLLGPTYGNDTDIADMVSGFCSNPMEYAEASKVSLYSIADYTWNTPAYDPLTSWDRAIRYLVPDSHEAFRIFCENNIDLGPTGHTLRRTNESVHFRAVAEPFLNWVGEEVYDPEGATAVEEQLKSMEQALLTLKEARKTANRALIKEIEPWIDVYLLMTERGKHLIDAYRALHAGESEHFVRHYQAAKELEVKQAGIRSRDFEGSIKNPRPMPANEVVGAFLRQLEGALVQKNRDRYKYRLDLFPQAPLKEGLYRIKVDGYYLTARKGEATPLFVVEEEMTDPKLQMFRIELGPDRSRYSIRSAEDGRYIDDKGGFGRYPYEAERHTFELLERDGKIALRTGGAAENILWEVKEGKLHGVSAAKEAPVQYLFEFVPVQ